MARQSTQAGSRGALIRRLAVASIAGQLLWVAIVVLAGLLEPGYSEVRDAVSVLGARDAARPWVFDVGVAIWGAAFIAAAAALLLDSPRSWRGWLGPALIAFTGLAQILDGFPFPADCRWSIDVGCRAREEAGNVSWQHVAHGWTYFLGAVALQLSVFAMAWRFAAIAAGGAPTCSPSAPGCWVWRSSAASSSPPATSPTVTMAWSNASPSRPAASGWQPWRLACWRSTAAAATRPFVSSIGSASFRAAS